MRVFVTGASGFIGAAVVRDLVAHGHEVTGLVRSDEAARRLRAAGATARRGTIEDLDLLAREAGKVDGVIHTAFFHAFSQASLGIRMRALLGGAPGRIVTRFMTMAVEADRRAIEALGGALTKAGSSLVTAFPTMAMTAGRVAVETDNADPEAVGGLRARSEHQVHALAAAGLRASLVRLPPSVHDVTKQGLVTQLIATARKTRASACVGPGKNRWCAVHRLDAASLFRLALENGGPGAHYHAIGEEPLEFREIAEAIGDALRFPVKALEPEDAGRHFGWLAPFVGADNPVSSLGTQERLGWRPIHPGLLADIGAALRAA